MATIVNQGLATITSLIQGATGEPNWLQWGTGATAESATDTDLVTSDGSRVSATSTQETTTTTDDTYRVAGTLTATATVTIAEVGLFTASTGTNLFFRDVFTGVALDNGEAIAFTLDTVFANA